jgi:hypothetical protein
MAADFVGMEAFGRVDFVMAADIRQQGRRVLNSFLPCR